VLNRNYREEKNRYLRVFDLDGGLYDYSALPDYGFYKLCDEANALAAREIFPELSYEKAVELSALSFKNHHDCYGAFLGYAASAGSATANEHIDKRPVMCPYRHAYSRCRT
jgi:hypothetical protein